MKDTIARTHSARCCSTRGLQEYVGHIRGILAIRTHPNADWRRIGTGRAFPLDREVLDHAEEADPPARRTSQSSGQGARFFGVDQVETC